MEVVHSLGVDVRIEDGLIAELTIHGRPKDVKMAHLFRSMTIKGWYYLGA